LWFDSGILIFLYGAWILATTLPHFYSPSLHIVVGNSKSFRLRVHPSELDLQLANNPHFKNVEKRITRLRVVESRGRWAEKVRVEVINVEPPHSTHPDQYEFLPWWSVNINQEYVDIVPYGTKWAILYTNTVNKVNWVESTHEGMADANDFTALLALTWNGKIVDAAEVHVTGGLGLLPNEPDSGFADVEITSRPTLRSVQKLVKERSLQRLGILDEPSDNSGTT
jgi:hypothetical protein